MNQKQLFLSFFRAGIAGFGGGNTTVLMMKTEFVEQHKALTDEEFYEIMAIGNTLPGPLVAKMAGYVGYRIGGVMGMVNALIATILPSILMMGLLSILAKYKESLRMKRLTLFIVPIIGALMLQLTIKFLIESVQAMSWLPTVLLVAGSYLALVRFKVNPALVIISSLVVGALFL
ncbi:chromate transporter [Kurthia senegalensis]|uniref:chromate transporter n=1 Tax=Kurthia senegalensis TaxID=1033740 RepID=UPI0002890479|nr:chromate transporter [Kurthia senegalensis]